MTGANVVRLRTGSDQNDVIRRSIRAWLGGWDRTRDDLAAGIGMPVRTVHRRLNGQGAAQAFSAGEVAAISRWMTGETGVEVTLADLYEGRINLGGGHNEAPRPDGPDGERIVRHQGLEPRTR